MKRIQSLQLFFIVLFLMSNAAPEQCVQTRENADDGIITQPEILVSGASELFRLPLSCQYIGLDPQENLTCSLLLIKGDGALSDEREKELYSLQVLMHSLERDKKCYVHTDTMRMLCEPHVRDALTEDRDEVEKEKFNRICSITSFDPIAIDLWAEKQAIPRCAEPNPEFLAKLIERRNLEERQRETDTKRCPDGTIVRLQDECPFVEEPVVDQRPPEDPEVSPACPCQTYNNLINGTTVYDPNTRKCVNQCIAPAFIQFAKFPRSRGMCCPSCTGPGVVPCINQPAPPVIPPKPVNPQNKPQNYCDLNCKKPGAVIWNTFTQSQDNLAGCQSKGLQVWYTWQNFNPQVGGCTCHTNAPFHPQSMGVTKCQ